MAAALYLFAASIGELHTAYCVDGMQRRVPGPSDAWILDAFSDALDGALSQQPLAPVHAPADEVMQRLRSIAASCEAIGASAARYVAAATAIELRLSGSGQTGAASSS